MVQLTSALLKYIPEWYHLKQSGGRYFKRQSVLYLCRYNKNISWSQKKNAVNRFDYALKGEMFYAALVSRHKRDINRSRIAAACDEHNYNLSRLAIYEPQTFKSLIDIAREATNTEALPPANFNVNLIDSKEDMPSEFVPMDSKSSQ